MTPPPSDNSTTMHHAERVRICAALQWEDRELNAFREDGRLVLIERVGGKRVFGLEAKEIATLIEAGIWPGPDGWHFGPERVSA